MLLRQRNFSFGNDMSYRWFLCTWNNPADNWLTILKEWAVDRDKGWAVGQREVSSSGTPHIQFVLWFKGKGSLKALKELHPAIHGDGKVGGAAQDCIKYCGPEKNGDKEKQGTVVPGTQFEFGKKPRLEGDNKNRYGDALEHVKAGNLLGVEPEILIKNLGNLYALSGLFKQAEGSESCRGLWIYGPPECGKSHYARTNWDPSQTFIKEPTEWWCGYNGEKVVLLEDLDKCNQNLGGELKLWGDKWPYYGRVKGKPKVPTRHELLIITSNYTPDGLAERFKWDEIMVQAIKRRFKFIYIDGKRNKHIGLEFGKYPIISDGDKLDINCPPGFLI